MNKKQRDAARMAKARKALEEQKLQLKMELANQPHTDALPDTDPATLHYPERRKQLETLPDSELHAMILKFGIRIEGERQELIDFLMENA